MHPCRLIAMENPINPLLADAPLAEHAVRMHGRLADFFLDSVGRPPVWKQLHDYGARWLLRHLLAARTEEFEPRPRAAEAVEALRSLDFVRRFLQLAH